MTSLPLSPAVFRQRVLRWFKQYGRTNLPWQQNITPYRIWLSEIMLQQTQVTTVIDYFHRFTQQFPTLPSLAEANPDQVLSLWSGLGYYQRARNLHKTAQIIMQEFAGEFPQSVEKLQQLPGIGRSTAGAIASFAFGQRAAILDGNVKRVLARFAAMDGWPGERAVHENLWEIAEQYTPHKHLAEYTQAMMDLGSLICTRSNPDCNGCPLASHCLAYQNSTIKNYPGKRPAKALPLKQQTWLILLDKTKRIILHKRPPTGLWASLWVFPTFEGKSLNSWCRKQLSCELLNYEKLPLFRHTFSHFQLDIHPIVGEIDFLPHCVNENPHQHCYSIAEALELGIPSPVKRCLENLRLY